VGQARLGRVRTEMVIVQKREAISSVAMNRVEANSSPRLICLSRLEQNLSGLELLPDLGSAITSSCTS